MAWAVLLGGNESALERLASVFQAPEATVGRSGSEWVLRSTRFDSCSNAREVVTAAQPIIDSINGACAVLFGRFPPLTRGSVIHEDGGKRHITVSVGGLIAIAELGSPVLRVTRADGSIETRDPYAPASRWVAGSLGSQAKAKPLRLRAEAELGFVELYRILEVITTELPIKELIRRGWANSADIRRFKHTANSVTAAGATGPGTAPRRRRRQPSRCS